jgi:enoyl-CoA hydratase/carnithine racemase
MVQTLNSPPRLDVDGSVATVWLQRPQLANRLAVVDIERLHQLIAELRARPEIRLVLLRGEGAHFCAGFQIDAVGEVDAPALFERLSEAWELLPQLTIAVVQGDAWGGAVDLALACDFRVGGARGRVGIPAARLGLHFYGGGMQRLVSRLGLGAAKRLLLAAEVWADEQRLRQGFLDDQAEDLGLLLAQWQCRLLSLAPLAQAGMKKHLNAIAVGCLDAAELGRDQARCAASGDLAEGLAAWTQRRDPQFSGA